MYKHTYDFSAKTIKLIIILCAWDQEVIMKHYAYDRIMIMIRSDTYNVQYMHTGKNWHFILQEISRIHAGLLNYPIIIFIYLLSATQKALELMQCPSYPTGDDVHVHR